MRRLHRDAEELAVFVLMLVFFVVTFVWWSIEVILDGLA